MVTIAFNRSGYRCACGCGRMANSLHHVFPRQRWPGLVDEPDNVIAVTMVPCHANHEAATHRFAREIVWRAERLAITHPQRLFLDRTYGPTPS
jgi:hypothetical protein